MTIGEPVQLKLELHLSPPIEPNLDEWLGLLVPLKERTATQQSSIEPQLAFWPGDCLWGCLGTMACLCGQQELSDDPLWIEAEIRTN
jgi:hypothetical protein